MAEMTYVHQRNPRAQRPCKCQPVCVDDFGDAVFRGHWSKSLVWPDEVIYLGPVLPQAPYCYVDGPEGKAARAEDVRLFDESEANCNTCRWLRRLPFVKDGSGLMPGRCDGPAPAWSVHPYPPRAGSPMRFAPEDWQGMPCWEAREPRQILAIHSCKL